MKSFLGKHGVLVGLALGILVPAGATEVRAFRRIRADVTRADRAAGIVHFLGNVRIDLQHGSASCSRADLDDRSRTVRCLGDVYVVVFSTADDSRTEVRAREASYDLENRRLVFSGSPDAVNTSRAGIRRVRCVADQMLLDEHARTVVCTGNVRCDTSAGSLWCDRVRWDLHADEVRAQASDGAVRFEATDPDASVTAGSAREMVVDIRADRISLIGHVEVVF